jgi:putative transposase
MMAPLVRRTWSPCGQTPLLYQKTRFHKKVSAIAALCVVPSRRRLHLFFRLHPHANINAESVESFLKNLLKELQGHIVIVWDRFMPHRSEKIALLANENPRLHIHFLPPYAPELNPVESIWGYTKMNPMANMAVMDLNTLACNTRRSIRSIQMKQPLLCSFLKKSDLSLRLK